jgi:hypothetical protein
MDVAGDRRCKRDFQEKGQDENEDGSKYETQNGEYQGEICGKEK